MTTLTEVVDGLAGRLNAITALDGNVSTVVRRPAVFPAMVIVPPAIPDYGLSLDGLGAEVDIPVMALVGTSEAEGQQSLLPFLDWAGPSSVPAVVAVDRSLGGLDVDARVASADGPELVEFGDGTAAYGVTLHVLVIIS